MNAYHFSITECIESTGPNPKWRAQAFWQTPHFSLQGTGSTKAMALQNLHDNIVELSKSLQRLDSSLVDLS